MEKKISLGNVLTIIMFIVISSLQWGVYGKGLKVHDEEIKELKVEKASQESVDIHFEYIKNELKEINKQLREL